MQEIRYVEIEKTWYLVACFLQTTLIWSEDGKKVVQHLKFDGKDQKEIGQNENLQHNYKGIAKVKSMQEGDPEAIAVGSSLGNIYFVQAKGHIKFSPPFFGIKLGNPINCLTCSCEEGILVAGDTVGFIHFIQVPTVRKPKKIQTVDTKSMNTPIICMESMVMGETSFLVIGDYLGKLKIFDFENMKLQVAINSHKNVINSLDVFQPKQMIISGSSDTYLNVWQLKVTNKKISKVSLKGSYHLDDQKIVGAKAISSNDYLHFGIVCYDNAEVGIFKFYEHLQKK